MKGNGRDMEWFSLLTFLLTWFSSSYHNQRYWCLVPGMGRHGYEGHFQVAWVCIFSRITASELSRVYMASA
jgi:hypothetical protein